MSEIFFFFLALTTLTNQGILFIKLPEFSCLDAPGNREIKWLLGLPIGTPLIRLILRLLCLYRALSGSMRFLCYNWKQGFVLFCFFAECQQPRMQIIFVHLLMPFWHHGVLSYFFPDTWIILSMTSRQLGSSVLFNNMALFFWQLFSIKWCFRKNAPGAEKPMQKRLHYLFRFVPDSWHLIFFFFSFLLLWGHNMVMLSIFNW